MNDSSMHGDAQYQLDMNALDVERQQASDSGTPLALEHVAARHTQILTAYAGRVQAPGVKLIVPARSQEVLREVAGIQSPTSPQPVHNHVEKVGLYVYGSRSWNLMPVVDVAIFEWWHRAGQPRALRTYATDSRVGIRASEFLHSKGHHAVRLRVGSGEGRAVLDERRLIFGQDIDAAIVLIHGEDPLAQQVLADLQEVGAELTVHQVMHRPAPSDAVQRDTSTFPLSNGAPE